MEGRNNPKPLRTCPTHTNTNLINRHIKTNHEWIKQTKENIKNTKIKEQGKKTETDIRNKNAYCANRNI